MLALLSAAVPLYATLTSALVIVAQSGAVISYPSPAEARTARSLHVFAYLLRSTGVGRKAPLVLVQSEGPFSASEWAAVSAEARRVCCGDDADKGEGEVKRFMRSVMEDKVAQELAWRQR